jgi:cbb3-type cytochrome oxidase maturation protein
VPLAAFDLVPPWLAASACPQARSWWCSMRAGSPAQGSVSILFVLIPLSLVLLGLAVWSLFWAIDAGQFENLDEASHAYESDDDPVSGRV